MVNNNINDNENIEYQTFYRELYRAKKEGKTVRIVGSGTIKNITGKIEYLSFNIVKIRKMNGSIMLKISDIKQLEVYNEGDVNESE